MTQNTPTESPENDHPITDFLIRIQWNESERETISLDCSAKVGDVLRTFDVLSDINRPDEYIAHIKKFESNGNEYSLELEYSKEDNILLVEQYGQACGTSTISWNTERPKEVKAHWYPENGKYRPAYEGPAVAAKLIWHKSVKELEYVVVSRLKRDQGRFRAALLKETMICEITGESELHALEAAHIVPVSAHGNFDAKNGLLLRADIHTLFDRGLLHIGGDGTVTLDQDFLHKESNYLTEANTKGWKLTMTTLQRVGENIVKRLDSTQSLARQT